MGTIGALTTPPSYPMKKNAIDTVSSHIRMGVALWIAMTASLMTKQIDFFLHFTGNSVPHKVHRHLPKSCCPWSFLSQSNFSVSENCL